MDMREIAHSAEINGAFIAKHCLHAENAGEAHGKYFVECFDKDGKLKWREQIENLVTTVGKNFLLDTTFAGSGFTAAWYVGLVDGGSAPTYNVADTMASHAGWTENQNYSQGARVALSMATAASAGSKAASAASSFSINTASQTIAGCFIATISTKGGTTGTLYSVGAFTGGNRSVTSGDTLNVTYTPSIT